MGPTDAAHALQSHRPRPSTTRPIVPAIPLPYIQKRKQQAAVQKKPEQIPVSAPSAEAPALSQEDTAAVVTNGISDVNPRPEIVNESAPSTVATPDTPTVEGTELTAVVEVQQSTVEQPLIDESDLTTTLVPSDQQSLESQSMNSVPLTNAPTNQAQSISGIDDNVKLPKQPSLGSHNQIHNAQQSAGIIVFGGYRDSNNSSPAPPVSAGGSQQPSTQTHNDGGRGHPPQFANGGHMHNFSNGYSPLGPPGPGYYPRQDVYAHQNTNTDFPRRHMVMFGPPDGYSPSGTPAGLENQRFPVYDPSTPQSFHGSQSSIPTEHDIHGPHPPVQYPTALISNGSNGHIEDVRLYTQPRPKGPIGPNNHIQSNIVQPQMLPAMDNLDGLVEYLQSQFSEPSFADYILELRYSDDRATPVRIPGHNLIFARSPTLKNLMTAQAQSNSDGITPRTLLIETDDRYLRSDGFWMAVQRLYGGPLLDPGASATATIPLASQLSSTMPGTPADRFELALGYAAAGNILKMPPVINRGIDIASHFVSWMTLEKALDFALDGGLDSQWTLGNSRYNASPSTYGPAVNMLIHSALNFIITAFPPNFELDTSVPQPSYNRRLPLIRESRPSLSNPRLSSIKFGDHSSEDNVRSNSNHSTFSALSKILLNLPFPLLKHVLESARLGNVQGWATTNLRQKVMNTVIEEREKRRNLVRESRNIPDAERNANSKLWEAVGWHESLGPPYGGSDTPTLTRNWIDFLLPGGN